MASSHYIDPNNCALDAQGNLKSAEDIVFYESAAEDNHLLGKARTRPALLGRVRSFHICKQQA